VSSYKIIGCHTDSPVLKLAPWSKKEATGYTQLNIQLYGGGLWRTWLDRDLTIAGKVIIKNGNKLESRYWNAVKPVVKIPNLCIHLRREEEPLQKESELKPIIGMTVVENLFNAEVTKIQDDVFKIEDKHFASLTNMIAKDLKIKREDIVDFELSLADTQPSQIMGMHNELVSAPRLDNLASSLCALDAIVKHSKVDQKTQRDHSEVNMIVLFDHEEIGSTSAQGADSNLIKEVTQRISECFGAKSQEDHFRAIRGSIVCSADMAHAIHPNH